MGEQRQRRGHAERLLNELADVLERHVYPEIDEFAAAMVCDGEQKEGHPVSCKACTVPACCYQIVTLSIPEALLLARQLRREQRNTPELSQYLRVLAAEQHRLRHVAYFAQQRPCPFLDLDRRCSVYAIRPAACRAYWIWSPFENCGSTDSTVTVARSDSRLLIARVLEFAFPIAAMFGVPLPGADWMPAIVELALRVWARPERAQEILHVHAWRTVPALNAD